MQDCESITKTRYTGWARINPKEITPFLNRSKTDKLWQFYFRGLYDSIRLLFRRIFHCLAPEVKIMENQLNERDETLIKEDRDAFRRIKIKVEVRRKKVAVLEDIQVSGEFNEHTQWITKMPPLPAWKSKKRKRKSLETCKKSVVLFKKVKVHHGFISEVDTDNKKIVVEMEGDDVIREINSILQVGGNDVLDSKIIAD